MKFQLTLPWQRSRNAAPVCASLKKRGPPWETVFENMFMSCVVVDCWPVPMMDELMSAGEEL